MAKLFENVRLRRAIIKGVTYEKMNILLITAILMISSLICTIVRYVYGLVRMRVSGEKFFRAKKYMSKKSSIFWLVICLANIMLSGWSIADYFSNGHARYYVADIVDKASSVTVYLAALILLIMYQFEHVYISDKHVVVNGSFYPSDKVLFWVKHEKESSEENKQINLYYKNTKLPFCRIPFDEKTPEEDFYKVLKTYKYRDLPETKARYLFRSFLVSWIIVSALLTAGFYAYFTAAKPWITVGKCAILKDQKDVSFSYLEPAFPYYSDADHQRFYHYFKPKKSLDGELYKLKDLTELKYLNIRMCSVTDLSFLNGLDGLEELYMGGGDMYEKPDDYSPLDHLTGLKVFEYYGAGKFDRYEALQKMPELHTLLLTHRKIGSYDIDQIKKIPSLENLSLGLCEISDDSDIGTLSGIKVLDLGGASIADPSVLAEMDSVETLSLSGIEADDYSFLLEMKSLKKLYIDKDKVPEELINALEKKGVEV